MENTNVVLAQAGAISQEQINQVALMDSDGYNLIADLTAPKQIMYCSMTPKNEDEEIDLYNAMNNPSKRLGDCINKTIEVVHVFAELVQCTNKETGEVKPCPRIVLIGKDGESYQCVSVGIYSALKKLFMTVGEPHMWKKPLKLEIVQITKGERKLLTLNRVK